VGELSTKRVISKRQIGKGGGNAYLPLANCLLLLVLPLLPIRTMPTPAAAAQAALAQKMLGEYPIAIFNIIVYALQEGSRGRR